MTVTCAYCGSNDCIEMGRIRDLIHYKCKICDKFFTITNINKGRLKDEN